MEEPHGRASWAGDSYIFSLSCSLGIPRECGHICRWDLGDPKSSDPQAGNRVWYSSEHSSTGRAGTSSHLSTPEGNSWVSPEEQADPCLPGGPRPSFSASVSPSASWRGKQEQRVLPAWDFAGSELIPQLASPSLSRAGVTPHLVPVLPLCPLRGQMPLHLSSDVRQSPRAREERSEKSWQLGQCPDWGRKVVWRLRPRATRVEAHSFTLPHKRLRSALCLSELTAD